MAFYLLHNYMDFILYFLQFFKHIYLQQVITSVIMQNDNKTDIQSVTSYKMLIY